MMVERPMTMIIQIEEVLILTVTLIREMQVNKTSTTVRLGVKVQNQPDHLKWLARGQERKK
jgi:hypothetical protein